MDQLYSELKKGRSPQDALRTAKLGLLHSDSSFRKPIYWAPFQFYADRKFAFRIGLSHPRQHQRHIIRLLVSTDPIIHRGRNNLADFRQRQLPVFPHQLDQPLFPEFSVVILRFSHAVTVSQKDVPI